MINDAAAPDDDDDDVVVSVVASFDSSILTLDGLANSSSSSAQPYYNRSYCRMISLCEYTTVLRRINIASIFNLFSPALAPHPLTVSHPYLASSSLIVLFFRCYIGCTCRS